MEKLDNQIEQKERELQQLKSYRQTAKIEEIATIDQEYHFGGITNQEIKGISATPRVQEKKAIPNDKLLQAKAHIREMMDQISNEGIPNDGNDPRLIASERLCISRNSSTCLEWQARKRNCRFRIIAYLRNSSRHTSMRKLRNSIPQREQIAKKDKEIEKTEQLLETAIKEGNAEKIIEYSDSLETAKKTRAYLEPMVKEIENSETFTGHNFQCLERNLRYV